MRISLLLSAIILMGCVHFVGDQKLVQFAIGGTTIGIGDQTSTAFAVKAPTPIQIQKYERCGSAKKKKASEAARGLPGVILAVDPEAAATVEPTSDGQFMMTPNGEGNFRLVALKEGLAYDGVTVMARPCTGRTFANLVINNAQGKTVTADFSLISPGKTFTLEKGGTITFAVIPLTGIGARGIGLLSPSVAADPEDAISVEQNQRSILRLKALSATGQVTVTVTDPVCGADLKTVLHLNLVAPATPPNS